LHEYWWILSRTVYHIAWACECNMIHCTGQYSPIFMQTTNLITMLYQVHITMSEIWTHNFSISETLFIQYQLFCSHLMVWRYCCFCCCLFSYTDDFFCLGFYLWNINFVAFNFIFQMCDISFLKDFLWFLNRRDLKMPIIFSPFVSKYWFKTSFSSTYCLWSFYFVFLENTFF
jgi:hypothetical protein